MESITTTLASPAPLDGRNQRRLRSRQAMIATCQAMMIAGNLQPSALALAEKGGVSVRTVFDHFGTIDRLRLEASRDFFVRVSILKQVMGEDWHQHATVPEAMLIRIVRAVVTGKV